MSTKAERKSMGTLESPITCDEIWVKECNFDHKHIQCLAWVLIDRGEQALIQANTYGGNLGSHYDPANFTNPLPGQKELEKRLKEYTKLGTEGCPATSCHFAQVR